MSFQDYLDTLTFDSFSQGVSVEEHLAGMKEDRTFEEYNAETAKDLQQVFYLDIIAKYDDMYPEPNYDLSYLITHIDSSIAVPSRRHQYELACQAYRRRVQKVLNDACEEYMSTHPKLNAENIQEIITINALEFLSYLHPKISFRIAQKLIDLGATHDPIFQEGFLVYIYLRRDGYVRAHIRYAYSHKKTLTDERRAFAKEALKKAQAILERFFTVDNESKENELILIQKK